MPPSTPKFASKISAPLVAEIRNAVEKELQNPAKLSPAWIAYRAASAQMGSASEQAKRMSALASHAVQSKRVLMDAVDAKQSLVLKEQSKFFSSKSKIEIQTRRLGRLQADAAKVDTRLRIFKLAHAAAQEKISAAQSEVRRRSAELSQGAASLGLPTIQSHGAEYVSADLSDSQIEAYRNSGRIDALWGPTTVQTLRLQVRTTLSELDPGNLQLTELFENWKLLYADLLDATKLAYGELNRVTGKYVRDVDARRKLYIKLATGLLGAGLSLVGAQKVADLLGAAVEMVLKQCEGINASDVLASASAAVGNAADEVTDLITGDIADLVEKKINNVDLPNIRKNIEAGAAPIDVIKFLEALKDSIRESLDKLRATIIEKLNGLQVKDEEIMALLSVMMQRHGLAALLQSPTSEFQSIRYKHKEVYEKALQFYDARAALILNELFAMYECRSPKKSLVEPLKPVMEKWVFAQYIASLNDDQLKDMANATTGTIFVDESALVDKLASLGVLSRRASRGGLDEQQKRTEMSAAQAGLAFTVGKGEVGATSRGIIRAWAESVLRKTPLEYALELRTTSS